MSVDPLTEAREALREIWRENSHGATANAGWITKVAETTLARLDALPAPERISSSVTPFKGWYYPDATRAES